MTTTVDKLSLNDWLDDLSVRFLVNLAPEELENVSRICFQVEEAQWFYEDFIRPLDPTLPPLNLRSFTLALFQRCHLFSHYPPELHVAAYEDFIKYKKRVPVRGAILLNEDMTEAVLVKGWKKGSRWSFPRGKINKEEGDLACAVREVYEETGYDLHSAGLVRTEEETKKIEISIREQEITLFVFRGVPKNAHFEARTRKEISDIRWWKISDLLKNKTGKRTQQINGEEGNGNGCYMVAPFIGPLKSWIREQRKLDLAKANRRPPPPQATDTEDIDAGDTTADDAAHVERLEDGNFANLIANLGRTHRKSDALPEVSQQPAMDPAAELKRLLSVGDEESSRTPTVEAPASAPANGLSALLHPSNRPAPPLPHTPIDQFSSNVMPPQSPHHHIPHPPANLSHLSPPPPFNYPQQHRPPFYGPQPPQLPPQQARTLPMPFPPHAFPSPPRQHAPTFPAPHAPHVQHDFDHDTMRPYQHVGDGRGPRPPSFSGAHGPVIPSGPKLPPPKLTSHTLGLLNAFKGPGAAAAPPQQTQSPAARDAETIPRAQQRSVTLQQPDEALPSPPLQSAGPYGPTPPPLQSLATNGAPLQPKPRSAHHNALLSLFRSPSVSATSPEPPSNVGPVELSAHPVTPGQTASQVVGAPTRAPPPATQINPDLLNAFGPPSRKADLTSATVTGPVNVPDFETVRKNAHIIDGHSRDPSPAQPNTIQQKPFVPQMILKRPNSGRTQSPVEVGSSSKGASPPAPSGMTPSQSKVFQPQILKRPQQAAGPSYPINSGRGSLPIRSQAPAVTHASPPVNNNAGTYSLPSPSLQKPSIPAGFDRRESQSTSQKDALLSLFSKAPQPTDAATQGAKSSDFHQPPSQYSQTLSLFGASSQPRVQAPTSVGPQPPTPKSIASGVISPVSPLPDKGSQVNSPAQLASRSRISSIGDTMPLNIAIPKGMPAPLEPLTAVQTNGGGHFGREGAYSASNGVGSPDQRNESKDATSPVNSSFLRGFLEDVARRGR